MKLILYDKKYKNDLEELLIDFSIEVYGDGTVDIDSFVDNHFAIYLAIDNEVVVGFTSYFVNEYFGLREPTIANSYLYISPEYRNTKLMYLFAMQSANVCIENEYPLEHYYASDGSLKLSRKLKGKKMYETYIYDLEEVSREYNRLKKIVKIKD